MKADGNAERTVESFGGTSSASPSLLFALCSGCVVEFSGSGERRPIRSCAGRLCQQNTPVFAGFSRRSRRRFATGVLWVIAGLLGTGCPTPPKPPPRLTPLGPLGPATAQAAASAEARPEAATAPVEPALAPVRDHDRSILATEQLALPSGMLPVPMWAPLLGFEEVRALAGSNPPALELKTSQGLLTLVQGQRFGRWNGLNVGLGFAPSVRNGEWQAHSVDVLKNFYPLALGTLPARPGRRVLVLDPGHGGPDPGSRSIHQGGSEKELTLDWALRVERLLQGSSWQVVLTRRDDRELALLERVAIAEAHQGDLFISLHFNSLARASAGSEETGAETYCLTPVGAPSNVTRNFDDDPRRVYPNNQFDSENLLLAARLQASLVRVAQRKDRGVKRARFMTVVREQKRPAALVEGGFLSSASESRQLLQADLREQLARAVCEALPH